MSKKDRPLPTTPVGFRDEIIRELDHMLSSGYRGYDIFDDWLEMVYTSLEMMPFHLQSAAQHGTWAEQPPETTKVFERVLGRYKNPVYMEHFSKAFSLLMLAAEDSFEDVLGMVFMEWGMPNKWAGQFFTPGPVAQFMAQLTMGNVEQELYQRLAAAYKQSKYGKMHSILTSDERVDAFVKEMGEKLVPLCIENFEPLTICDPAVGSGVMLLAAASLVPSWALQHGLVRFYGMDIDQTCVRMCRVNLLLHGIGLPRIVIKHADALSDQEISALPPPHAELYTRARQAFAAQDDETLLDISKELRQLSLWAAPTEEPN